MGGFWHEQKMYLFVIQVDLAFTGQNAGPGIENKGLTGGNSVLNVELDDGTFNLFCLIMATPQIYELWGEIYREHIEVFCQEPLTHHSTDGAIKIRHEAVNRIPAAIQMSCDVNGGPNLIVHPRFLEKAAQAEVLNEDFTNRWA